MKVLGWIFLALILIAGGVCLAEFGVIDKITGLIAGMKM